MENYSNRDGLSTSWGAAQDVRWDAFRALINDGLDPQTAAHRVGLEND